MSRTRFPLSSRALSLLFLGADWNLIGADSRKWILWSDYHPVWFWISLLKGRHSTKSRSPVPRVAEKENSRVERRREVWAAILQVCFEPRLLIPLICTQCASSAYVTPRRTIDVVKRANWAMTHKARAVTERPLASRQSGTVKSPETVWNIYVCSVTYTIYCTYIAFDYGSYLCPLYRYTCISEMAFSALLFCTNLMNTSPEEGMKPLVRILFVY